MPSLEDHTDPRHPRLRLSELGPTQLGETLVQRGYVIRHGGPIDAYEMTQDGVFMARTLLGLMRGCLPIGTVDDVLLSTTEELLQAHESRLS